MLIGKFNFGGKLPRNKAFNYVPVYYNPKSEELEQRVKEVREKTLPINQREKPSIKFDRHLQSRREERKSNVIRLSIIIFLIALVLFFIFK